MMPKDDEALICTEIATAVQTGMFYFESFTFLRAFRLSPFPIMGFRYPGNEPKSLFFTHN